MSEKRSKSKARSPKQARSKATVDAILTAAARVFGSQGEAGTTAEVARVAGVSVGSIYEYFDSKESLVEAVRDRFDADLHRFLRRIAEPSASTVGDEIDRWFDATIDFHRGEPGLHRLREPSTAQGGSEAEYRAEAVAFLARHVESVRPADHDVAARVMVGVLEALVHQPSIDSRELLSDEAYLSEVRELLRRYLIRDLT